MTRKPRGLSASDLAAWRAVAETVTERMPGKALPPQPAPLAGLVGTTAPTPAPSPSTPPSLPRSRQPSPGEVERKLRRRLAAGRQTVEAALDLHGLRQAEAHARLQAFLTRAQQDGSRVVLVVTGKGRGGEEGGVLRRLVPLWLAEQRLASLVVGFGEAGRGHGGAGAIYIHVRTRRRRASSD